MFVNRETAQAMRWIVAATRTRQRPSVWMTNRKGGCRSESRDSVSEGSATCPPHTLKTIDH